MAPIQSLGHGEIDDGVANVVMAQLLHLEAENPMFGVEITDSAYVTGQVVAVDGGLTLAT